MDTAAMGLCRTFHRRCIHRRSTPPRFTHRLALLTAASFCTASPARAQANVEQQIRSNQERLEEIRRERDGLRDELDRIRGKVHTISSEMGNLERQKSVTTRMVNELDRQMGSMRGQLDTLTFRLVFTQDALAE